MSAPTTKFHWRKTPKAISRKLWITSIEAELNRLRFRQTYHPMLTIRHSKVIFKTCLTFKILSLFDFNLPKSGENI